MSGSGAQRDQGVLSNRALHGCDRLWTYWLQLGDVFAVRPGAAMFMQEYHSNLVCVQEMSGRGGLLQSG